jgi:hypothetical protein
LQEIIDEAFPSALRNAALEAFGGAYQEEELLKMIDIAEIKQSAINLLDGVNS